MEGRFFAEDGESPACGKYQRGAPVPETLPEDTVRAWIRAGIIKEIIMQKEIKPITKKGVKDNG